MKSRKSFEDKTRPAPLYLGVANDLKYYASSSSGYNYEAWTPEYVMTLYRQGMADRATAISASYSPPLGVERISTRSGRRTVNNNCEHWKQSVSNLPFFLAHWQHSITNWTPYSQEFYMRYWRKPLYGLYYSNAVQHAIAHSVVNDQMFSARAYWSMRPKLESGVSLINTIFELKDFTDVAKFLFSPKGLARVIAGDRKSLVSLYRSLGNGHSLPNPIPGVKTGLTRAKRYAQSKSVGEHMSDLTSRSTDLASKGVLTYNLAIMPTIRDAISIHAAAQKNVYEKLKTFRAYGDEGSTSHFSEEDTLYTTVTPGTRNNYCFGEGKLIRRRRTATMTSYYRLLWEHFEDMYPKWWGLEVGADEVWNMLPLSFVLDYVWTVGKSLEYMDRDPRIKVLGTEYMESIKVTAELGHFIIQSYRTPQLVIDGKYIRPCRQSKCHLVSGTCGKYYKRQIMEPYKGPALPKLKLPSATQSANMLALARCLLF